MDLGESCRADESGGNDRTHNSRSRWLRLPPVPMDGNGRSADIASPDRVHPTTAIQIGVADEAGRDARGEQLALPSHRRADFEQRRPVKQGSDPVASPRRADEKLVRRRSIASMQQQGLLRRHPDAGQLSSRPARSGASAAAHIRRSPGCDCDVYHVHDGWAWSATAANDRPPSTARDATPP